MRPAATKPPARYVTVSVKPATMARLLALLTTRESMDALVNRLIDAYPAALEFTRIYKEAKL